MYYNPYLQPQYQMQPMQQAPQPFMQQAAPQVGAQMSIPNQDERIWVQGEEAAKAFLVCPSSFVRLWDTQKNVFYEKRADASGKPSLTMYKYDLCNAEASTDGQNASEPIVDYQKEIDALKTKITALEERMAYYDADESYDDDQRVYEVQESVQRRSQRRSAKADQLRKD